MTKYAPLNEHLSTQPRRSLELSFGEIEKILGAKLPESAHRHPEWWGNELGGTHVQARSWIGADFRVARVDQSAKRVRFEPVE